MSFPSQEQFIRNTKNEIRRRMEINYNGEDYTLLNKAKHISDTNYDLLMISYKYKLSNAFAVCELCNNYRYTYEKNITDASHGNNLVTNIIDGKVTIDSDIKIENKEINTYVYIEFVYDKNGFNDFEKAYEEIHNETYKLLSENVIGRSGIFIFRVSYNDKGEKQICKELELGDNIIHIYGWENETRFKELMIPSTTKDKGLKYDEYMEFTTRGYRYSVQVEHSEGFEKHKSNILDFILYATEMKNCQERINKCLDILGYEKTGTKYNASIKYNKSDTGIIKYRGATEQNTTINNSAIVQNQKGWFKRNLLF